MKVSLDKSDVTLNWNDNGTMSFVWKGQQYYGRTKPMLGGIVSNTEGLLRVFLTYLYSTDKGESDFIQKITNLDHKSVYLAYLHPILGEKNNVGTIIWEITNSNYRDELDACDWSSDFLINIEDEQVGEN